MRIVPVELKEANAFIQQHHRHHKPVIGHRFSIGALDGKNLIGVAIIGRPVARNTDQRTVVEVTRLCTDGTKNSCSFLYGAAARTAKSLGYERIQTFTLPEEGGGSLRATGWELTSTSPGGDWNGQKRTGRRTDQPMGPKWKWEKKLNDEAPNWRGL